MADDSTGRVTMGLDVGDRYSRYCVVDGAGEVVAEGKVATTEAAVAAHFRALRPCRVVLEAGTHSPWLSRLVRSGGHEVVVANPRKLQLIAQSPTKSDRADAETLARLGRVDPRLLHPITHRSEQAQQDLAVVRSRAALVRARSALINQVRGTVKSVGGRLNGCDAHYFHRHAPAQVPEQVQAAVAPVLAVIATITARVKEMDGELERIAAERYPETQLLRQVKGVGPLISLSFVLTLGDPGRFRRSREVGAYLGLVPRQRQSGERSPQLRISKAGDPELRWLLVQGAHYILGHRGEESDLRRWGLERLGRGGANQKKRVLVAVARKLAVLLHRLWVTGEVYQPLRQGGPAMAA